MWRRLRDPRVLVVCILVGAWILLGATAISLASFTSQSSNSASVGAGSLVFTVTPTGSIVDTRNLRPGDTRTGQAQITNTKSAASFTLGFSGLGTGPLPGVLRLTVKQLTPTLKQLYDGTLAAVPTLTLGRLATGASIQVSLTFAWPAASTDPSLQAQSVPLVLDWNAST